MTRPFHGLRVWLPLKLQFAATFSACLGEKPNLAFPILLKFKSPPCIEVLASSELSVTAFAVAVIRGLCLSERTQHSWQLLAVVHQKNPMHLSAIALDGVITMRNAFVGPKIINFI